MQDQTTRLESWGWNAYWEDQFAPYRGKGWEPARVAIEDKHHYAVLSARGEMPAQVAGKVLHRARSLAELPKVGDWVCISVYPNEGKGVIHHILPRKTTLSRKVAGRTVEEQVLAANIDVGFIVQALDSTFNPRRLQRQLVTVYESAAKPVVVLNKCDLGARVSERFSEAQRIAGGAPVIVVSARTGETMERLNEFIHPGETVIFIGSSGVGKSTLINRLYGEEIQATADVRETDSKGRHTTSWREMIRLPRGGLVIDTPGMREFHLWQPGEGIQEAYPEIEELAVQCRFRNCSHTVEKDCAVLEAVANKTISSERYESYLKLQRELNLLETAQQKRAGLDRKRETKSAQRAFYKKKPGPEE